MVKNIFKVNLEKSRFMKKKEDYLIEFTISGEDVSYYPTGVFDVKTYIKSKAYFLLNNNVFLEAEEIFRATDSLDKLINYFDFHDLIISEDDLVKTLFYLNNDLCKYYRKTLLMKDIKRELFSITNRLYDILRTKYDENDLGDYFNRLLDSDDFIELDKEDIGFDLIIEYRNYLKENEKTYDNIYNNMMLLINHINDKK